MKPFFFISITFLFSCVLHAAELDFNTLFDELFQIQKALNEEMLDDEDTPAQRAIEKRVNEQILHVTRVVQASPDERLKTEYLKLEYLFLLSDSQFDLDYAETPLERAKALGEQQKYQQRLKQIQAWLDAQPQPDGAAPESPSSAEGEN
ncbi:MAG: hypothetical protein JJU29_18260 [Verrucomicrobia bacterium]|nr:hypothetical protein [Verrucomicrobiota bacterium]MCH8514011.1 hypothetical protein [Kiritimatiellia bacterium]